MRNLEFFGMIDRETLTRLAQAMSGECYTVTILAETLGKTATSLS